jgi:hypothetical protein
MTRNRVQPQRSSLLLLLLLPLMWAISCRTYHSLSSEQAEVNLSWHMYDKNSVLLIYGKCRNKSNTSLSRLRVTYVTETTEGGAGPSGIFYIHSGPLAPSEGVDFSHELKTKTRLKLSNWSVVAERPYMGLIRIALIGLLMAGGLAWQILITSKDISDSSRGPTRILPPIIVSVVLLLGVVVHSTLSVLDDQSQLEWWFVPLSFGKAVVLSLLIVAQSYLGPVVTAFVLSCCAYFWLTDGRLHDIPVIQTTFEWALNGTPESIVIAYVILVTLYAIGGSLWDGV